MSNEFRQQNVVASYTSPWQNDPHSASLKVNFHSSSSLRKQVLVHLSFNSFFNFFWMRTRSKHFFHLFSYLLSFLSLLLLKILKSLFHFSTLKLTIFLATFKLLLSEMSFLTWHFFKEKTSSVVHEFFHFALFLLVYLEWIFIQVFLDFFLLGVDIFPSVFGLFLFFRGGEVKFWHEDLSETSLNGHWLHLGTNFYL